MKIFSVFDQKASAYLPPFFLPNRPIAVRTFADCVNTPDHPFNKHPADYLLVELGEWDETSAAIDLYPALVTIGTGFEYKDAS